MQAKPFVQKALIILLSAFMLLLGLRLILAAPAIPVLLADTQENLNWLMLACTVVPGSLLFISNLFIMNHTRSLCFAGISLVSSLFYVVLPELGLLSASQPIQAEAYQIAFEQSVWVRAIYPAIALFLLIILKRQLRLTARTA